MQENVQYINGKFYGEEDGNITKTLLCVILKSLASKYRDIVCMTPIVTINAGILEKLWRNVVEQVRYIGYNVAVPMTDGHSANMKLFNEKLLQDISTPPKTYSLPNP